MQKLSPDGVFLDKWEGVGVELGQFDTPTMVYADAEGNLFVADVENNRVQFFPADGGRVVRVGVEPLSGPHGITFDADGTLYVADTGNGLIRKFRLSEE